MIKLLGTILVLCSAVGFGLTKGLGFLHQLQTVKAFSASLEILKCEMNYTLSPLPKLCKTVSGRTRGACARFFASYGQLLEEGIPRNLAARKLLGDERKLSLPRDARMALLELFESIGAYELDGENRLLRVTAQRLHSSMENLEKEKKPLAKSYAALGLCTGLALVILFV
ncbi:MAG: stage III sporulation protein AB [Oscillospiraceae bacterium]|nr:stage III sporulation protein AB [Oscillospiraceae bacterium]